MVTSRTLTLALLGALGCAGATVHDANAQDLSRYRGFALGSDLAAISKVGGLKATEARIIHARPALIQEISWRPPYMLSSAGPADPVQEVVFSFYNGQLFRVVVVYDRYKTEGMSNEDLVAALSTPYGRPIPQAPSPIGPVSVPAGSRANVTLAEWDAPDQRITLSREVFPAVFRLVVASKGLSDLAQTSITEAIRLDTAEAPQRDADRRAKELASDAAAREKAGLSNKAAFRP